MSKVSTLYNANVYMGGDNWAGLAEEITLPVVKAKETDFKALSNIGGFKLTTGMEPMDAKIKWTSTNKDVMKRSADFYNSQDVMIRSNQDNWENGSRVSSVPVVVYLRGLSKSIPGLAFKHQDNVEAETEFNVTGYKLEIDGEVIYDIDYFANVYIVNGVDLMADYRANLGL